MSKVIKVTSCTLTIFVVKLLLLLLSTDNYEAVLNRFGAMGDFFSALTLSSRHKVIQAQRSKHFDN